MKRIIGSTNPVLPKKRPITMWLLGIFLVVLFFAAMLSLQMDNLQNIKYDRLTGPLLNPLMGWAPWATIEQSNQPHTLVYANLTWRDFEPQEGSYDFGAFEAKQQLARWRQEGKRIVFRFVADMPGQETHLDIPDWLFGKIGGKGNYYDNEYGKGFSPDYSNPVFIEYHKKAIKALGERYGKDGFFAFIELGSLGHWGEWHTHPGIKPLPSQEIRNLYVYHYIEAFPGTHLLMRRPFSIAQQLNLGLYNDMTGDVTQTNMWLDWIEQGGEYSPQGRHELSPMPLGWQKAPIGGEQAPDLSNEQLYGSNLDQTLLLLKRSHTTFIGPDSPYAVESGASLQNGIDQILASIGYRLYLDRVQMPRSVLYGKDIRITLTLSNSGIAPLYYNWPTQLYVLNEDGNIVATSSLPIDLGNVLPGEFYKVTTRISVDHLRNGTYSIGIAIIDPITGQPGIKFANRNVRQDLIQYIGQLTVKRIFNPN